VHRRGVAYRTPDARLQYRQQPRPGEDRREQFRGHVEQTPPPEPQRLDAHRQVTTTNIQGQPQLHTNAATAGPNVTGQPHVATGTGQSHIAPNTAPPSNAVIPGSQHTNAINGVSRGPAVLRESQRGQQQLNLVQHTPPPAPHPSPPPPPHPAPPTGNIKGQHK